MIFRTNQQLSKLLPKTYNRCYYLVTGGVPTVLY
jgi:hypothetical protein